ncbi:mechanosensitive ion channel [Candidatus Gracilibacteria bacterium]|nr:mechanosensitive ion channel [Candidatus Gracilibacteria bacterium]
MDLRTQDIQNIIDQTIPYIMTYTPKIIGAFLVLWIGFKIANIIEKVIEKVLKKQKMESTIRHFVGSLLKNILKAIVFVAAIGMLGVETSSFIALFATIGIAIGMALSGTLSHFASGIMILIFKPYKVGDLIETAGHFGTVKEVQIFNTILKTIDAKTIIIPNSDAIGGSIVNFSMEKKRRIDLDVGISYSDSIDKAREVMQRIAESEERILDEDGVTIVVKELGDNAVIFAFRVWVKTEDYWSARFHLIETIKKEFDKAGINFPFPQRDVHIYNEK